MIVIASVTHDMISIMPQDNGRLLPLVQSSKVLEDTLYQAERFPPSSKLTARLSQLKTFSVNSYFKFHSSLGSHFFLSSSNDTSAILSTVSKDLAPPMNPAW